MEIENGATWQCGDPDPVALSRVARPRQPGPQLRLEQPAPVPVLLTEGGTRTACNTQDARPGAHPRSSSRHEARGACARLLVAAVAVALLLRRGRRRRQPQHVRAGVDRRTGGNAAQPPQFVGASADGTRVFLRTEEALAPTDTDASFDIYENAGGGNQPDLGRARQAATASSRRRSSGAPRPTARASSSRPPSRWSRATPTTAIPDDPAVNGCADVYERADGVTTLVSTGPAGGNGRMAPSSRTSPRTARRVFFTHRGVAW